MSSSLVATITMEATFREIDFMPGSKISLYGVELYYRHQCPLNVGQPFSLEADACLDASILLINTARIGGRLSCDSTFLKRERDLVS